MTSRAHSLSGRRARRGWAGLLLLTLFVVGQAFVMAHHSLVVHHVCAADGELTHGDHHHHAEAAEVAQESEDRGPVAKPTTHESEHGEHCSIPKSRDERKHLVAGAAARGCGGASVGAPLDLVAQTTESSIPLFRLAPKQSPPGIV